MKSKLHKIRLIKLLDLGYNPNRASGHHKSLLGQHKSHKALCSTARGDRPAQRCLNSQKIQILKKVWICTGWAWLAHGSGGAWREVFEGELRVDNGINLGGRLGRERQGQDTGLVLDSNSIPSQPRTVPDCLNLRYCLRHMQVAQLELKWLSSG